MSLCHSRFSSKKFQICSDRTTNNNQQSKQENTMTTLKDSQDLNNALDDFAKNNPAFPADFVAIESDFECETVLHWFEYRADDDRLTLYRDIDLPISWEDFETQIAELWDDIDFWENPVEEEDLVCIE